MLPWTFLVMLVVLAVVLLVTQNCVRLGHQLIAIKDLESVQLYTSAVACGDELAITRLELANKLIVISAGTVVYVTSRLVNFSEKESLAEVIVLSGINRGDSAWLCLSKQVVMAQ